MHTYTCKSDERERENHPKIYQIVSGINVDSNTSQCDSTYLPAALGEASAAASGALLGNPVGPARQKVILNSATQAQVLDAERSTNNPEKLALALLMLLFSNEELAHGNYMRPVRNDTK